MESKMSSVQPTFLFDDRKRFDAQCEHDRLRSSLLSDIEAPTTADPWKRRPIDFTMKNFHPSRKKESKQSSNQIISARDKRSQSSENSDGKVMEPFIVALQKANLLDSDEDFQLDTRIEYERVQRMLNTEQYRDPKLHDYRQYPSLKELGLPEFFTKYDKDPYNIQFLSNRLNTLWLQERQGESVPVTESVIPEMYRSLSAKPKWESRLILPKLVFPNKYAAYTRYRNPTRTVQSAYWERVEDHLEHQQKKTLPNKHLGVV